MSSESDSEEACDDSVPVDMIEKANNISLNLLPEKSRRQYIGAYEEFKKWLKEKKTISLKEEIILVYLDEISKHLAPSTLWARYSMLKATISTYDNVDIGTYKNVKAFLKRKSANHKRKKSKVFSPSEVSKFCSEATDEVYLLNKVVLVIGISGACRREELTNITLKDIKDLDRKLLLINIPKTKTGAERSFSVVGDFYEICKRYLKLRPKDCKTERLFLNYRAGKCTNQPVGINKIGAMPKVIASFLQLPDPELYTGHSFRRTSATLLVEAGRDITAVKKLGGWKSTTVAEGYIEASVAHKRKIGEQITNSISIAIPSTSKSVPNSTSPSTSTSSLNTPSSSVCKKPRQESAKSKNDVRIDSFERKSTSLLTDAEKWSQEANISSTIDESELEELFSTPFESDEKENSSPSVLNLRKCNKPSTTSASQQLIATNLLTNERFNLQFNNCTVTFVINEKSTNVKK